MDLKVPMERTGLFHAVIISAIIAATLAAVNPSSAQDRRQGDVIRRSRHPVAGRYLVAVRSTDDPDAAALTAQRIGRGRLRHVYRHGFRGFAIETSEATARALASDPGVAYVEEDGVVRVSSEPQYQDASDIWGLDRIDQRVIWKDGAGAYDHRYHFTAEGAGVNVYVLDTGIRTTHVEFGGRAFNAFDARAYERVAGDCNGHGTHVAGIVGGARYGVAKLVTLHSVRVLGCDGYGYISDVVAGIDWVNAYHLKPAVINMSVQAGLDQAITDSLHTAIAAGITVVGAAGNGAGDSCLGLMGQVPDAIVVGASDYGDARTAISNYGTCVDLFAPGAGVLSSWGTGDTDVGWRSGTSQASPHVAGAAALYLERKSNASPQDVAAAILGSATAGAIINPGAGTPNRLLFTPELGDMTPPAVSITEPAQGATIQGVQTVSVSVEDDAEIAAVVFAACGAQIGSDSLAPYSVDWDSTRSPEGDCSLDVQAVDVAGNVAKTRITVLVTNTADETPPQIQVTADRARIRPPNGALVPVTFTGSVSDNESVITGVSFTTVDEYGKVQPSGVAAVQGGQFQVTLPLEARRRGNDTDGRRYVVNVTATDLAGNTATAAAEVRVGHDRR
jgi:subtilisin family serine protease